MGRVIVTTGNYSKTPYLLKNSKLSIHSIEELCYCIVMNPELCEDFLYDRELPGYIDNELGLKERASLLADSIERDAPLKELIGLVFGSCDYLLKEEKNRFLEDFSRGERSEKWVRIKNKGDGYLQHENYKNAAISYRNLIKDAEALKIPGEILGDIYHNMGIATLNTEGFAGAADLFRQAYERNNREESLKSYLLALRFAEKEEEYRAATEIYDLSEETSSWLKAAMYHTEREAEEGSDLYELSEAVKLLNEGKVKDFYTEVEKMTLRIRDQYRKYNE